MKGQKQLKKSIVHKMVHLRSSGSGQQRIEQKDSLPEGKQVSQQKSLFGSAVDSELLVWLKGLAIDPCDPKAEGVLGGKLWHQTIRLRKVFQMINDECPRRKRKLQQFLNCHKFPAGSGLVSKKFRSQNVKQLGAGYLSSIPNSVDATECPKVQNLLNSCSSDSILTSEDSFRGKQFYSGSSFPDNSGDRGPSIKHFSLLIDTDESVNDSNPLSPENVIEDGSILCCDETIHSSGLSLGKFQPAEKHGKAVRFLKCDYKSRPVIPVGPSFQAEIPEWKGPINQGNLYGDGDSETLKWLGTRVWPNGGKSTRNAIKVVGKGRPHSCTCVPRAAAECVKRHILEASLRLKSELGPTFFSWKFNEMGEKVSKSWSLNDQRKFERLMKVNPFSTNNNFWRKYFPSKRRKNILSYYYNVFIPRRISQLTRSSLDEINSEEDEDAHVKDLVKDDEDNIDGEDVELSRND